jgi:hypothetical protein
VNRADYDRLTERQFVELGAAFVTTRLIQNGVVGVPAGTRVSITRKFGGFGIESAPCSHCGVTVRVTKVEPSAIAFSPVAPA